MRRKGKTKIRKKKKMRLEKEEDDDMVEEILRSFGFKWHRRWRCAKEDKGLRLISKREDKRLKINK